MNKFYKVSFNSPEWVCCYFFIELTETDSEATLQRAIEDAFTSYQNHVADACDSDAYAENLDDYGKFDELGYESSLEKYRDSCYVEFIKKVNKSEVDFNNVLLTEDINDQMEW